MVSETTKQNKEAISNLASAIRHILASDYENAILFIEYAKENVEILKQTKDKEEW